MPMNFRLSGYIIFGVLKTKSRISPPCPPADAACVEERALDFRYWIAARCMIEAIFQLLQTKIY